MAQPQLLFGRAVNVKIFATIIDTVFGEPVISYDKGYTQFSAVQADGSQGYRIRGRVNKVEAALTVVPNPATVMIYNLGPNSRTLVQSKVGTKIVVEAGYSTNVKQILLGDILWANTHKEGPDYITEILIGDGSFAVTNGMVNQSFAAGTTYMTVINFLISSLANTGLSPGTLELPQGSYNQGMVLTGSPLDNLHAICDKLGLHMLVQSGEINIIPLGQDLGIPVIEVSTETGMIGIPQLRTQGLIGPTGASNGTTPDNIVSFKTLLNPQMQILQKVHIDSKFIKGNFIVGRVTHDFDSFEGSFWTECECIGL